MNEELKKKTLAALKAAGLDEGLISKLSIDKESDIPVEVQKLVDVQKALDPAKMIEGDPKLKAYFDSEIDKRVTQGIKTFSENQAKKAVEDEEAAEAKKIEDAAKAKALEGKTDVEKQMSEMRDMIKAQGELITKMNEQKTNTETTTELENVKIAALVKAGYTDEEAKAHLPFIYGGKDDVESSVTAFKKTQDDAVQAKMDVLVKDHGLQMPNENETEVEAKEIADIKAQAKDSNTNTGSGSFEMAPHLQKLADAENNK